MDNIIFRILGCVLVLWGISICFDPLHYSSRFGRMFDYTGINIPFGLIVAALGVFFIWSTFKKQKTKEQTKN
jgi:hypothetical protein